LIAPDIILKSNRKTLSLCIMKDGQVVVRVPTRAKQCDIDRFILEKQGWLAQKLAFIQNIKTRYDDVSSYQKVLYLGERYTLKRGRVRGIVIGDDFSIIIPEKLDSAKILSSIKKWYKKEAKAILEKRTQEISNKIKLFASEIKINDSIGRCGA